MNERFKETSNILDSLELEGVNTDEGREAIKSVSEWLDNIQHDYWVKSLKTCTNDAYFIYMAVYHCIAELDDYIEGLGL